MESKLDMTLDEIIAVEGITGEDEWRSERMARTCSVKGPEMASQSTRRQVKRKVTQKEVSQSEAQCVRAADPGVSAPGGRANTRIEIDTHCDRNRSRSRSHFSPDCGQIFIENIKYEVTDDDLKVLFNAFGQLKRAGINYLSDGRSAGTALVVFADKCDAKTAFDSINGLLLDGRPLRLRLIDGIGSNSMSSLAALGQRIRSRPTQASLSCVSKRQVWTERAQTYDSYAFREEVPEYRRKRVRDFKDRDDNDMSSADLDIDLDSYVAKRIRRKEDF